MTGRRDKARRPRRRSWVYAVKSLDGIRWDWLVTGRAQPSQTLRRLAQFWLEAADAEPGQGPLHPVHDPGAFADQTFALAIRTFGVLLFNRRNRDHPAVAPLAT